MMGGGKGGADFDPKGKSDNEIRRFVSYLTLFKARSDSSVTHSWESCPDTLVTTLISLLVISELVAERLVTCSVPTRRPRTR
jgi:hypothetical protein